MKSNWIPAILLVLIAMVLPELATGSSSISSFLNPGHLLILFLGYGIAVLLFRETAVRNNLTLGGIFILGFAFGIFNEGFLAKTLIQETNLPISQYNQYGYFLGVSFPFTFVVSFWHAAASVLIPILLVYSFYPRNSYKPWLGKKTTAVLAVIFLFSGAMSLLGKHITKGTPKQLLVLLGLMAIAFLAAKILGAAKSGVKFLPKLTLKPLWLGTSLLLTYFLLLMWLAEIKLSPLLFFAIYILTVWGYYFVLKRNDWLSESGLILFGIGLYLQNIVLGMLIGLTTPNVAERLVTGFVLIIFFSWLARKILKKTSVVQPS